MLETFCAYLPISLLEDTGTDIIIADSLLRFLVLNGYTAHVQLRPTRTCMVTYQSASGTMDPSHVFWLFSFERYNGLLGSQPNNDQPVEIQLIKRFIDDKNL